ncbi:RNA guanine-N7 methyltransferase activating subunit [Echeneis naucrates]|uniref:RNA guanine-7 methyltransferase activating subunit n=1 Tax=Echeneis naucrates TaxID=173247 RepID=A0A665VTU7_ECHNA|nr:RNA guanine-N7 methyltransferase activating subunit [Echeneis naucrates]XP_029354374.1 RNA guanine-N7 methyltransferase activating subunit [Echeneis naucrates]
MAESTGSLQKYEELFAHRFSSEDQEYQQYLNRPDDPPPIVEDWRGRSGGNQRGRDSRYQDRRGRGGGRGWGGEQGWRGDFRERQHWGDRDRRWGHGSDYQSGGSNQGYNSHRQRPYYNR